MTPRLTSSSNVAATPAARGVFLFKCLDHGPPLVELLETFHGVSQDMEPAFEIQVGDHPGGNCTVARILSLLQHVQQLIAAGRERIAVVRVDCHVRRQVVELRASPRIVLCAHHHGD
jgi:hypothetical protein